MTICNMAIEAGAKYGIMQPDETTYNYVKGRSYAMNFNKSINWWKQLYSDEDAYFDKIIQFDVSSLEPQVTWGTNPEMGVNFSSPFLKLKIQMMNVLIDILDLNLDKELKILILVIYS